MDTNNNYIPNMGCDSKWIWTRQMDCKVQYIKEIHQLMRVETINTGNKNLNYRKEKNENMTEES